jgi:hypothetical protein
MYIVSTGVRNTRNEDGGIILDIAQGQMFRLNPVGALILDLLKSGYAEIEIVKEVSSRYGVGEEIATVDVADFLKSLEENRLICKEPGETAS